MIESHSESLCEGVVGVVGGELRTQTNPGIEKSLEIFLTYVICLIVHICNLSCYGKGMYK